MYHVISRVLEILDISERITSRYEQLEAIGNKHRKEENLRENRLQSKTDVIHDTSAELSVSAVPHPPPPATLNVGLTAMQACPPNLVTDADCFE